MSNKYGGECSECGGEFKKEFVVLPRIDGKGSGSRYKLRSYEEILSEEKKRAGYKYTCVNNRWWKFWDDHQVLYKKVEIA